MKKMQFTMFIVLWVSLNCFACTIIPESFCSFVHLDSNRLIVSGKIISIDDDGLDLEVIDVIRGEETKSIIRIWDGTDFECNGTWSMESSTIGEVNDDVIIVLPQITEVQNGWDVIGDYRTPNPYYYRSSLKIENGIVNGFISGSSIAPPEFNLLSIEYDILKEAIISNEDCNDLISSNRELLIMDNITFTNPIANEIVIQSNDLCDITNVDVYSINGVKLRSESIVNEQYINIPFGIEPSGLYILEISTSKGEVEYLKVYKN